MCGIVGYMGYKRAYLNSIGCLKRLEYREYERKGVACVNEDRQMDVFWTTQQHAEFDTFAALKDISNMVDVAHTSRGIPIASLFLQTLVLITSLLTDLLIFIKVFLKALCLWETGCERGCRFKECQCP